MLGGARDAEPQARSSPHPSALLRPCLRPSECVPDRSVLSKTASWRRLEAVLTGWNRPERARTVANRAGAALTGAVRTGLESQSPYGRPRALGRQIAAAVCCSVRGDAEGAPGSHLRRRRSTIARSRGVRTATASGDGSVEISLLIWSVKDSHFAIEVRQGQCYAFAL